jgi:hypothetical protein
VLILLHNACKRKRKLKNNMLLIHAAREGAVMSRMVIRVFGNTLIGNKALISYLDTHLNMSRRLCRSIAKGRNTSKPTIRQQRLQFANSTTSALGVARVQRCLGYAIARTD